MSKRSKNRRIWVPWQKLLNKSLKQTLTELQVFLNEKGLMEGNNATEKAYELNFVREENGKERWNLDKYIKMMKADKKRNKLREQGKRIHPALTRRALINQEHVSEMCLQADQHLRAINSVE